MHQPRIAVIIGASNARETLAACLTAVTRAAQAQQAEVIVADGSTDGSADLIAQQFPEVVLIRASPDTLVPQLWGLAIRRARAPLIAITTAACIPADDWLATIAQLAAAEPYAAIGGPIDGPIDGSLRDWAVYFCRYTAYLPPGQAALVAEVPGDNAAYRMDAIRRSGADLSDGFWETLVHHRLRAVGEQLYMSPALRVRLGRSGNARAFMRARFRHGQQYGATRPATSGVRRIVRVLAAPALLPFLLVRSGKRVAAQRRDWLSRYLLSLPWQVLFMGAWTIGEASGYLHPQPPTP